MRATRYIWAYCVTIPVRIALLKIKFLVWVIGAMDAMTNKLNEWGKS